MKLRLDILRSSLPAILTAAVTLCASAQELNNWDGSSVQEQMQQFSIFSGYDDQYSYILDYAALLNAAICEPEVDDDEDYNEALIAQLLDYAATFRGTRYRSGSASPSGFDCSGFTSYVYARFGYELNRSSSEQVANGPKVERNDLKPGDLVFFNGRKVGSRVGHVGIVTEVNHEDGTFNFIHSSNSRGVIVSTSEEPYYKRRYVGACRPTQK